MSSSRPLQRLWRAAVRTISIPTSCTRRQHDPTFSFAVIDGEVRTHFLLAEEAAKKLRDGETHGSVRTILWGGKREERREGYLRPFDVFMCSGEVEGSSKIKPNVENKPK